PPGADAVRRPADRLRPPAGQHGGGTRRGHGRARRVVRPALVDAAQSHLRRLGAGAVRGRLEPAEGAAPGRETRVAFHRKLININSLYAFSSGIASGWTGG